MTVAPIGLTSGQTTARHGHTNKKLSNKKLLTAKFAKKGREDAKEKLATR